MSIVFVADAILINYMGSISNSNYLSNGKISLKRSVLA